MGGEREHETDASDEGPVWPPRAGHVPTLPFMHAEPLDLRIDTDAAVVEAPEFTPSKLTVRERQVISQNDESPGRAVVFDPKNPSGRTAIDRVFDAKDEDFRRTRWRLRRETGLAGAFVYLVVFAGFQPPAFLPFAFAALVGCAVGMAAEVLGDRSETWLLAALVGALPMALLVNGPMYFIVVGALAGGGWLTGFVREVR